MHKQVLSPARRTSRTGLRAALAVAVTGAAVALSVGAASAMPTDYVKDVKVDSGETLHLDGNKGTVTVKDPEHGVTNVLDLDKKRGPVDSRMDPNGTFTLQNDADGDPTVVYKHEGKTVRGIDFPQAPADLGR